MEKFSVLRVYSPEMRLIKVKKNFFLWCDKYILHSNLCETEFKYKNHKMYVQKETVSATLFLSRVNSLIVSIQMDVSLSIVEESATKQTWKQWSNLNLCVCFLQASNRIDSH